LEAHFLHLEEYLILI